MITRNHLAFRSDPVNKDTVGPKNSVILWKSLTLLPRDLVRRLATPFSLGMGRSVVFTFREGKMRIISARRSRKEEIGIYEGKGI